MRLGLRHVDERGTLSNGVAYYRVGPRPRDEQHISVLFIHGFTLAAGSFFLQVEHLSTMFPAVTSLLFDVRGHGDSPATAAECTIDGAADDAFALIRAQAPKGKLLIVGHSLGGMIALNLIKRAPEDIRERLAGVLLLSTAIESLASQGVPQVLAPPVVRAVEGAPEKIQRLRQDLSDLLAPALAATVFFQDGVPYKIIEFHAEMIKNTPIETIIGYLDDLTEHDEEDAASALCALPGRCVVGDRDRFTPVTQTKLIASAWPQAQVDVRRKVGHMVILEDPDAVNAHVSALVRAAIWETSTS